VSVLRDATGFECEELQTQGYFIANVLCET
jgi:hypothetical protein